MKAATRTSTERRLSPGTKNAMNRVLLLATFAFCISVASAAIAQEAENNPGLVAYIPTRMEWLALLAHSRVYQDTSAAGGFLLGVVQSGDETLTILVTHGTKTDRQEIASAITNARRTIMNIARTHGWHEWVKIQERVILIQ
jgi:hypothetical protein